MTRWMIAWALTGCLKAPRDLDPRDPRIGDELRVWLVDAHDEVVIARARLEDAENELRSSRDHHEALMARIRAAGVAPEPWQALGRARGEVAVREVRRAVARVEHAEARRQLVRAEVATASDLRVYDLEPLRAEVARQRKRLTEAVREVERATAIAENRADEAWTAWHGSGTPGDFGRFWHDVSGDAPASAPR